ncbi:hypothetical protein ACFV0T_01670 [Streptomyces sp. NPDC059582]|uniref:hypothetical protein n=1 Tax=Streptomyces sp. NPDC059582 TaxID=3346875 RepID=UPI00368F031A
MSGRAEAAAALVRPKSLLDSIHPAGPDPDWLSSFTHARLAADATEICRDLERPRESIARNGQTDVPGLVSEPTFGAGSVRGVQPPHPPNTN